MEQSVETLLARAGDLGADETTHEVAPPIHVSTTFERDRESYAPPGPGRVYSRASSLAYDQPEALLARLEGGGDAALFSSGLAACSALLVALLRPGEREEHVLVPADGYFAIRLHVEAHCRRHGVALDAYADEAHLEALLRPGATRLVWLETPSNPTWRVVDVARVAKASRAAGAEVAVDSTVLTPLLCRPLELGADYVMHAATKFLNGHSDVVAGALACRDAASAGWKEVKNARVMYGGVLGPFEAWLLLRGMRTLHLRVERSSRSALAIASGLQGHPAVEEVLYPGLPTHPGHDVAVAQQSKGGGDGGGERLFGGLLSVRVRHGAAGALALIRHLRVWIPATSLGGVESLIEHRYSIEGDASGVPKDMLRLSVGIEDAGDLLGDLQQALDKLNAEFGGA